MNKIVVVGNTHHNTLSIIRNLGKCFGEVSLILIGEKNSYLVRSKYLSESIILNDNSDLIPFLLKNEEWFKHSIIISCSDGATKTLDDNYGWIKDFCTTFNSTNKGGLSTLMDKERQVELAELSGIKVPLSVKVSPDERTDFQFNYFPCILKPCASYAGGKNIHICRNNEELRCALCQFPNNIDVIVQEFIEKEYEIVIPGAISKGEICMPAYIMKHRETNGATTYSTVKKHNSETSSLSKNIEIFLKGVGYDGLFGAEFIYSNGNFYFLEMNFRNDATSHSLDSAGANIVEWYVESKMGLLPNLPSIEREVDSMVEFNDFSFVLRRKLGISEWINELRKSECKYYFDKGDKSPFYEALSYWLKNWTIKKI